MNSRQQAPDLHSKRLTGGDRVGNATGCGASRRNIRVAFYRVCYRHFVDVLVVDPGELGALLSKLLQQYGFTTERVDTGDRALTLALEKQPSVIIVDAELPDTSGLDLAELLRDELQSRTLLTYPASFTAANAADRMQRLDGAFVRPFRSLALIESVGLLLGRPLQRLPGTTDSSLASRSSSTLPAQSAPSVPALPPLPASSPPLPSSSPPSSAPSVPALPALPPLPASSWVPVSSWVAPVSSVLAVMDESPADFEQGIEILLADEFADDADGRPDEFVLQDFDPGALAVGDIAEPADDGGQSTVKFGRKALSSEASWPLEVVSSEKPVQPSGVSPVDLMDLRHRVKERRTGGMPPLRPAPMGAVTPRLLADLLDALHHNQFSGGLNLTDGSGVERRVLLLERGVIVGARSTIEGEDLISLLLRRKAIAADDADDVRFMLSHKQFRTVTEAVLASEYVPEGLLVSVLAEHVRLVAIGAFSWRVGRYQLIPEQTGDHEAVRSEVHVGAIIVQAIILTEDDDALRRAAPDDARFATVGDTVYGLEHLKLSPAEARVVMSMDGTKTILDLMTLHAPISERVVRGLAAGLFCLNLTRFLGRGPAAARRISFF